MSHAPYRSWVEVSRTQIADNFNAVRRAVGPGVEVMPVVKADAYRHGSREVSRVLEQSGARWLAVSSVEEGVVLRDAGITSRILVMAGFLACERAALLDHNLTPAIHSLPDLAELDLLAARRRLRVPFHLKIDTGLGRLGTREDTRRIADALSVCRDTRFEGLMTHFASAALYASPQTDRQIECFRRIVSSLAEAGHQPRYTHLSATIPIAYGRREAWGNMVRPGHAIYGYVSPVVGKNTPAKLLEVKPALEWKAAIIEVRQVSKGTPIGYGAMYKAERDMQVGILSVGYADGLPHRLSNKGHVIAAGRTAAILGAVSMDLTAIDLTEAASLKPGDAVTLLGTEADISIDAQQIARQAGTISYSVLCGISARVKRVYT